MERVKTVPLRRESGLPLRIHPSEEYKICPDKAFCTGPHERLGGIILLSLPIVHSDPGIPLRTGSLALRCPGPKGQLSGDDKDSRRAFPADEIFRHYQEKEKGVINHAEKP